jgi:hypothetical protein
VLVPWKQGTTAAHAGKELTMSHTHKSGGKLRGFAAVVQKRKIKDERKKTQRRKEQRKAKSFYA